MNSHVPEHIRILFTKSVDLGANHEVQKYFDKIIGTHNRKMLAIFSEIYRIQAKWNSSKNQKISIASPKE